MTIRERFAKYTLEELKAGVESLNKQIEESDARMEAFKREKKVEFFRQERDLNDSLCEKLMDAQCALTGRIDELHGPVIETKTTQCAVVWIHADGYREIVGHDEMRIQKPA